MGGERPEKSAAEESRDGKKAWSNVIQVAEWIDRSQEQIRDKRRPGVDQSGKTHGLGLDDRLLCMLASFEILARSQANLRRLWYLVYHTMYIICLQHCKQSCFGVGYRIWKHNMCGHIRH
jgi:hypothetical protein